ncbi:MAG: hypothetical protein JXK07_13595 [Spirochaetes bacterium]|nr:hypothetical protein [Spirochaetota bacterium]MBN2770052.1 hypothetical protein [Spirochaetota bacterium]HRX14927.1 hypothetical protein [Spirochaetota bacterium]
MTILLIAGGSLLVGFGIICYFLSDRRSLERKDSETWENLWMSRLDR